MVKKRSKYIFEEESYGRYSQWDSSSKKLPSIKEFTTVIPAQEDIEFGSILRIKKGKGQLITFCINHPDFTDINGDLAPPFCGEYYVTSNDFRFFIGDKVWLPLEDKKGKWEIVVHIQNNLLLQRSFQVI